MIEKQKPSFYSVIPATVRYDKRISPNAKLLYAEITSLLKINGKCYATNGYFAKLYGVSKKSVSNWIKSLVKCGYIKTKIIYKKGSKEIEDRYIQICGEGMEENLPTPMEKKVKDNNPTNVDYNNTLTESNNNPLYPPKGELESFISILRFFNQCDMNVDVYDKEVLKRWRKFDRWMKKNDLNIHDVISTLNQFIECREDCDFAPVVDDIDEMMMKWKRIVRFCDNW